MWSPRTRSCRSRWRQPESPRVPVAAIRDLATLGFVEAHESVIVYGPVELVAVLTDDMRARLARDGTLAAVPETIRLTLARLEELIERHRALWNARNRPGGLADSQSWLEHLRTAYETGRPDPDWGGLTVAI